MWREKLIVIGRCCSRLRLPAVMRHGLLMGHVIQEPCCTLWLCTRSSTRGLQPRYGARDIAAVDHVTLYSRRVRESLAALYVDGPGADGASSAWHAFLEQRLGDGMCVGIMLVQRGFARDPFRIQSVQQEQQQHFWEGTRFVGEPLLFFHILEMLVFTDADPAYHAHVSSTKLREGMFWKPTQFSQRAMSAKTTRRGLVSDVLLRWQAQWHFEAHQGQNGQPVCISIPLPHVAMLKHRLWDLYSAPLPLNKRSRASLGWSLVPALQLPRASAEQPLPVPEVGCLPVIEAQYCSDHLALLRRALAVLEKPSSDTDVVIGDLKQNILQWEARRRSLVEPMVQRSKQHWDLLYIVHCLVLAGFFRSRSMLRDGVLAAIPVITQDSSLAQHLQERIFQDSKVLPSPSTMYRKQLNFVMAWCQLRRDSQLSEKVVRWCSIDCSPQGGVDWILHGFREMSLNALVPTYQQALQLVSLVQSEASSEPSADRGDDHDSDSSAASDCDVDCELIRQQLNLQKSLRSKLQWHLNLPAGVGSGRADVRYKAHALLHSERLMQPSWSQACSALSSTFSITGDLGTESRLSAVKIPLHQLFGAWVCSSSSHHEAASEAASEAPRSGHFTVRAEVACNMPSTAF